MLIFDDMKHFYLASIFISSFFMACTGPDAPQTESSAKHQTPAITYAIGAAQKHDTANFTEGFEFYKGLILESTGLEGKSKLVAYDPASGKVSKQINLDEKYFGEGITVFRDTVYQLTYRESIGFMYRASDLKKLGEFPFTGEGWGLTHDSTSIIATNGTSNLYFYQPGTMKLLKTLPVTEGDVPAVNINELEYVNGFIYANQWQINYILKIDPATGVVVGKMDLSDLVQRVQQKYPKAEVLNGIAYNPDTKKIYVTGKNWPEIYELQFAF